MNHNNSTPAPRTPSTGVPNQPSLFTPPSAWGGIVRLKRRTRNYLIIDKAAIEDARLRLRAVGLHTYLNSRPPDWEVRVEQLAAAHQDGRDAIRSALAELRNYGYARLDRVLGGRGRVSGWAWTIFERPDLANGVSPETEKPDLVETVAGPGENPSYCVNSPETENPIWWIVTSHQIRLHQIWSIRRY